MNLDALQAATERATAFQKYADENGFGRPQPPTVTGYGCLLTEDTDMEALAALPECEHCDGTGKNLAGSPWELAP